MKRGVRLGLILIAVVLAAGVAGTVVQRMQGVTAADSATTTEAASPGAAVGREGAASVVSPGVPQSSSDAAAYGAGPAQATTTKGVMAAPTASNGAVATPMIVTTDALSVRVSDVRASVDRVRALASASGAQVADLTYSAGGDVPTPVPVDAAQPAGGSIGGAPSSATITLRVPASKLEALEQAAGKLGTVLAQTSNQTDVTAQHVDLAARLKNLRAEEARLRTLFDRAASVSSLLEVEQELSQVRGEIESLQGQLAYLEQQVALSTLTISLSEPGAIVRPASGISWGFTEAVTQGIQSAAALVRTLIVGLIAIAPVLLLLALAWGIWRIVRWTRARGARSARGTAKDDETATDA